MFRMLPVLLALLPLALASKAEAQSSASYRRADGQMVEAKIFSASGAVACAPLAIVSHGLGGSSDGNAPLAAGLARTGYRVVVPSHVESGPRLLLTAMRGGSGLDGIAKAASDPKAHQARMMDIDAILEMETKTCAVPFKLLAGHSMGARSTLVEAGAKNSAGIVGKNRFDMYVAVSPQGEGYDFFPQGAMSGIQKPVLMITGTEDKSVDGGMETRLSAFEGLPPGKKRAAIINGADHSELGGKDPQVGAVVGALAAEFSRHVKPGPWQKARTHIGVTIKEK